MQRLGRLLGRERERERPPTGSGSAPCAAGLPALREKGRGALHRAAASGDLPRLQQLLSRWWKTRRIDGRDAKQQTPLHLACENGHANVIRFLAGNKCQLNLPDSFQKTPLMKAVEKSHKDCVAVLLEHGAKTDLKDADGNTALHLAAISASKPLVGLLLEYNAPIDAQNELGYTPLTLVIAHDCEEMVRFLLQNGADMTVEDKHERTALAIATNTGNMKILELLQHSVQRSHEGQSGHTSMYYSIWPHSAAIAKQGQKHAGSERTGEFVADSMKRPAVFDSSFKGHLNKTTSKLILEELEVQRQRLLFKYRAGRILLQPYVQKEDEKDDASSFNSKMVSEGPTKVPSGGLLLTADGHAVGTPSIAKERSNGVFPAAPAAQEEDDDSLFAMVSSQFGVSLVEKEDFQLKKDYLIQADFQGNGQIWVWQLLQELADELKKNSLVVASLEAVQCSIQNLQEEKWQLQKKLDRSKAKLQKLKEQRVRTECYATSLKNSIKNDRERRTKNRKLQSRLTAPSGTAVTQELEECMQRSHVRKTIPGATVQQAAKTTEAIQKEWQTSDSAHNGQEDSITGFQTTRTAKEHQCWQCGSASTEARKLAKMKYQSALLDEIEGRTYQAEVEDASGLISKLMVLGEERESQLFP